MQKRQIFLHCPENIFLLLLSVPLAKRLDGRLLEATGLQAGQAAKRISFLFVRQWLVRVSYKYGVFCQLDASHRNNKLTLIWFSTKIFMVNKEYFLLIFSSCKGWHNRCIVGVKHLLNIAMGKASKKKRLKTSTPPQEISDNNISTGILSKPFLHIFFIITLGILIYSNTFKAPFVFDDISMYIVENPAIKDFKYFLDA